MYLKGRKAKTSGFVLSKFQSICGCIYQLYTVITKITLITCCCSVSRTYEGRKRTINGHHIESLPTVTDVE